MSVKTLTETFNQIIGFLEKWERVIFILLIPVFLFPIWHRAFFPTLDTPGHIYNASVLWDLWFGNNELYSRFFKSNDAWSPNWISQPLLAILTQLFDPATCEKLTLSIYISGFLMAFRSMMIAFKPGSVLLSFLGFVFVYNNTFIMGFVNYNFGLVFLFLSISALLKFEEIRGGKQAFGLFVSMTLLFYSHLVMFCVFGLFALAFLVVSAAFCWYHGKKIWFWNSTTFLRLVLATFFPATLLLLYLISAKEEAGYTYFEAAKIIDRLILQTSSICIARGEKMFLRWNWIILAIGIFISGGIMILQRIKGIRIQPLLQTGRSFYSLLLFLIFLLITTFTIPDSSASGGGLLTDRLIFLCIAFFIVCMFLLLRYKMLLVTMTLILLYVSFDKILYLDRIYEGVQAHCTDIYQVSEEISEGGIMAVFDFTQLWPTNHFTSHIATANDLVVLDNWPNKDFSSVQWKAPWRLQHEIVCWQGEQWHCDLYQFESKLNQRIKWFLVIKEPPLFAHGDAGQKEWSCFLSDSCDVTFRGGSEIVLYKRKGM